MSKPNKILGIIFMVFGIAFIGFVAGFIICHEANISNNYTPIEAEIVGVSSSGSSNGVRVRYEIDGVTYDYNSDYANADSDDTCTLYINPDNPQDCKEKMSVTAIWGLVFLSLIPFAIFAGFGYYFFTATDQKGKPELMQTGKMYNAHITEAGPTRTRFFYSPCYKVWAKYTDDMGEPHEIKTPLLCFDPIPFAIKNKNRLAVYVDRKNPKKYYIDIDEMAKVNIHNATSND